MESVEVKPGDVILREGETIDSALKRLKNSIGKAGVFKEVKRHANFEKPGEAKRRKHRDAVNREKKYAKKRAKKRIAYGSKKSLSTASIPIKETEIPEIITGTTVVNIALERTPQGMMVILLKDKGKFKMGFVTGGKEHGETSEEASIREMLEEVFDTNDGVNTITPRLFYAYPLHNVIRDEKGQIVKKEIHLMEFFHMEIRGEKHPGAEIQFIVSVPLKIFKKYVEGGIIPEEIKQASDKWGRENPEKKLTDKNLELLYIHRIGALEFFEQKLHLAYLQDSKDFELED